MTHLPRGTSQEPTPVPSRRFFLCVLLAAMVLGPLRGATAGLSGGIGVLGDSYSDEYRFYPPDRSTARNWVEILTETRGLNFGSFSVASRGEPRNQGFEFNWARSDATTDDLIASGQHTGVAAQVARGEVGLVFVFIGGNDFINALNSADPAAALRSILPRALANYRVAVRTVLRQPGSQARPRHAPRHPRPAGVRRADPGGPDPPGAGGRLHRGAADVQRPDPFDRDLRTPDRGDRPRPDRPGREPPEPGLRDRRGAKARPAGARQRPRPLLPGRLPAPRDAGPGAPGADVRRGGQRPVRRRDRTDPGPGPPGRRRVPAGRRPPRRRGPSVRPGHACPLVADRPGLCRFSRR